MSPDEAALLEQVQVHKAKRQGSTATTVVPAPAPAPNGTDSDHGGSAPHSAASSANGTPRHKRKMRSSSPAGGRGSPRLTGLMTDVRGSPRKTQRFIPTIALPDLPEDAERRIAELLPGPKTPLSRGGHVAGGSTTSSPASHAGGGSSSVESTLQKVMYMLVVIEKRLEALEETTKTSNEEVLARLDRLEQKLGRMGGTNSLPDSPPQFGVRPLSTEPDSSSNPGSPTSGGDPGSPSSASGRSGVVGSKGSESAASRGKRLVAKMAKKFVPGKSASTSSVSDADNGGSNNNGSAATD